MSEKEKFRKLLRPYIIFFSVLCIVGGFIFIQWFYGAQIKPNIEITQSDKDTVSNTDSKEIKADSTVMDNNVVNRSPIDSLFGEKQKLQDSLLMEVMGRGSGNAGYGTKARAIQKQLEEMERTIEILQNHGVKKNVDTLNKSDNEKR